MTDHNANELMSAPSLERGLRTSDALDPHLILRQHRQQSHQLAWGQNAPTGVVQNFGNGLTASAVYVPNYNNVGGQNNGAALTNTTGTNGAYEIGLRGSNIANSGVNLNLWRNETTKAAGETKALSGTAMTIGYAKAPFSFDVGKMPSTIIDYMKFLFK